VARDKHFNTDWNDPAVRPASGGDGLRTTPFSILARLKELGPTTINALAHVMVVIRTTLGRNILPLQRRRPIIVKRGANDARRKELHFTKAGLARLAVARPPARRRRRRFPR
jgi:DNA-binding MarR family transcriptional regulator